MTYSSLNKSLREKLRELAGLAYERELGQHLGKLHERFDQWRDGKMLASELSDHIHEFHDGASRDLYGLYGKFKPDFIVARALGTGILTEDEVPVDVRQAIAERIEAFRRLEGPG
jgi:hypothetical protein